MCGKELSEDECTAEQYNKVIITRICANLKKKSFYTFQTYLMWMN